MEVLQVNLINLQKLEVTYNKNVEQVVKGSMTCTLGVRDRHGKESEKVSIWGFLLLLGRIKKKNIFNFIKEKVWHKINYWSGKRMTLSMAGIEVLIKFVMQAIPYFSNF